MENVTDVVVVDGKATQLLSVKRVDFNDENSLFTYGDEYKDAISAILENVSKLSREEEEIQIDDAKIKKIVSFEESLDESDKNREKNEKSIFKGLKNALTTIGVKKFEEEKQANSYQARYQDYCSVIDDICNAVESQKQGTLNDIEMRKATIDEMLPYIKELQQVLEVGKEDLQKFNEETEILRQNAKNDDDRREVQTRELYASVFNTRLDMLEKVLTEYKEQIQAYRIQQKTSMELVMQQDSYLRDQAPILKAQGSVMVYNRRDEAKIDTMRKLSNATNMAIQKNAKDLVQNAEAIVELSIEGGITAESLIELKSAIDRGTEIFREGNKKKQARIESDRKVLENINASLDEYQNAIYQLVDSADVFLKDKSPIKKLGTYNGPKKF